MQRSALFEHIACPFTGLIEFEPHQRKIAHLDEARPRSGVSRGHGRAVGWELVMTEDARVTAAGGEVSIRPLPTGLITVPDRRIKKYPGLTIVSPIMVCAYLVQTPETTVLLDTGIETTQEGIEWYAGFLTVFPNREAVQLAAVEEARQVFLEKVIAPHG